MEITPSNLRLYPIFFVLKVSTRGKFSPDGFFKVHYWAEKSGFTVVELPFFNTDFQTMSPKMLVNNKKV